MELRTKQDENMVNAGRARRPALRRDANTNEEEEAAAHNFA